MYSDEFYVSILNEFRMHDIFCVELKIVQDCLWFNDKN